MSAALDTLQGEIKGKIKALMSHRFNLLVSHAHPCFPFIGRQTRRKTSTAGSDIKGVEKEGHKSGGHPSTRRLIMEPGAFLSVLHEATVPVFYEIEM